ncbi:hypothetical protein [Nocardia sp. NPDC004722]
MKSALLHRLPTLLATGALAALCATGAAQATTPTPALPVSSGSSGSSSGSAMLSQLECTLLGMQWDATVQACAFHGTGPVG